MTISAATLKLLIDAGISGDQLISIVESMERDATPSKNTNAERQARYRARKASSQNNVTSNVTNNVTEASQKDAPPFPPLSSPPLSPTPPNSPPIIPPKPTPENKKITRVAEKTPVLRVSLDELSTEHVSGWLSEKRTQGRYLTIDEQALLEMFKDYVRSKNPKYTDLIAAYRNSFNWQNAPTNNKKPTGGYHANTRPSIQQRKDAAFDAVDAELIANAGADPTPPAYPAISGPVVRHVQHFRPDPGTNGQSVQGISDSLVGVF